MKKVSFIIPAYNSTKTIKRAIDSILKQNNNKLDFEIIIVDDGSEDKLRNLIKQYESDDLKNIKYFKKENGGVASARNYGVQKAQGDYIIFVDSDDYVSKKLLKDIEKYINKDYDLIKWNAIWVDENKEEIKRAETNSFEETTGEDGFNKLYGTDPLLDCLWNYAIKKDIMLEFPEGTYHEDFAIMPLIMLNAKTMVITDKLEYYYVQTEDSIMRGNDAKKQKKKIKDILKHYDNLIESSNKIEEISKTTKENVAIFATNSLLVVVKDLEGNNKEFFKKELKKRRVYKNIKPRNLKQLAKRIMLKLEY